MQELMQQLVRLYLPVGAPPPAEPGTADAVREGGVRAIVIPFELKGEGDGARQWERLCEVANALQAELGLPAPAVSVSGATGFRLWLSFAQPVPVDRAQRFLALLRAAYFSDAKLPEQGVRAPLELPPRLHPATGKWAAFIHPGMGAAFADEPALEIAPPAAAQAALLQDLRSITPAQLQQALDVLEREPVQPPSVQPPSVQPAPRSTPAVDGVPPDLLLKDATLEDIVRFLHANNIEPTFRHLIGRD
ncbi:hypothetical protein [Massilia sp. METH4]|uniref:hypothetical protein n=1 Tax=Massilia sp. METH4 TaxID=3123041 RepID=UPI0030CF3762